MAAAAAWESNDRHRADAIAVLTRLRQQGFTAYFAGGCVRDELLGLTPTDFDIATDTPPDTVQRLFINTQAVGAAFGVILVRHGISVVEVATFRADLQYRDGRRPEGVRFATAQEDALRRDFTINGLFLDPLENKVIDYVGGQKDLSAGIIRAIGNPAERFAEDHLRLLRAVRFAARFKYEIDPVTAAEMVSHAHLLPRISPERIAEELRRMLMPATRSAAWPLLWKLELAGLIFRFFDNPDAIQFSAGRSVFLQLADAGLIQFATALAAATLDFRWQQDGDSGLRASLKRPAILQAVRALRQTLKISNEESGQTQGILTGIASMLAEPSPGLAAKKRFLATPTSESAELVLGALSAVGWESKQIAELQREFAELRKTDFAPPPWVVGDDLTSTGAQPGPRFKLALEAAYDAQLEGRVADRAEALKLALQIVKSGS